jgi:hypothetical protein
MNLSQTIIGIGLMVLMGCKNASPAFIVNNGLLVENVTIISANNDGKIEKYIGYVLLDNDTIRYNGMQKPRIIGTIKKN